MREPAGDDHRDDDAGTAPAPVLPGSAGGIASALGELVAESAEFAAAQPERAAAGHWWRQRPLNLNPRAWPDPAQARAAAVLVLFFPGDSGPQVLLTERSTSLAKHPGQISFPGGAVEEFDVDAAGTALREAQEEVALDPARTELIGALPLAPVPASGFMVTPVLAVTEDPGVLIPHSGEVARVLRLGVADLVDPAHRYTAVVRREGIRLPSPAFWCADAFVWGFTGILLDRMLERLGWAAPWDESRELDPRDFRR